MARKRSSGGLIFVIVAGGVAMWGLDQFFEQSTSTGQSPSTVPEAAPVPQSVTASEASGAASVWPPLADEGIVPAADLGASNYYIVLDGSGSMRRTGCSADTNKITAALAALERFVGTVPADANLGLAVFDDKHLSERVPLATGNRPAFLAALRNVAVDGGTPLRSAITLGYGQLTTQAQRQLGYGEYHLVVVTDGNPDPSSEDPTSVVEAILTESPVVLHTIGFCIGTNHVLNQPGRSYYMAANDPSQLDSGLSSVLAESPSFDVGSFEQTR
ncbi:MAG: vWA domain-containing protein [Sinimarinibacterium sp.]|jgi:uncharacterized protein YegL